MASEDALPAGSCDIEQTHARALGSLAGMNIPSLSAIALAGVLAAGCPAAPETRIAPRAPAWQDTGTQRDSVVAADPERRYYRDSTGSVWDDRGKRVGGS